MPIVIVKLNVNRESFQDTKYSFYEVLANGQRAWKPDQRSWPQTNFEADLPQSINSTFPDLNPLE